MKKELLFIALSFFVIFLISLASAVEIKLSKEEYAPGETLQAEIYGNFIDSIKLENIYFYRERNIPVDYDILKTKDKYLLYAILPSKEGNYTIKIKNIRYEADTGVSSSEIIKEFSIKPANETSLSFSPGFVVTKEDFYIQVKADRNLEITTEFLEEKQNIALLENKETKVYFSVEEIENYTEAKIKLNSYEIPVFIFPEKTQGIIETAKFRFSPSEISATILKKNSYFFEIFLINLGRKNISDITLLSNISESEIKLNIEPASILELEAGGKKTVNITISSDKVENLAGEIFASAENLSAKLIFNIEVTENISEVKYTGPARDETCEDMEGKVCSGEEKCSVSLVLTTDEYDRTTYCCKGECKLEAKSSNTWIYGLIIIIVVAAGLIFFSFYMKKKQRRAIDILKERENKYQERMSGETKEVRGSLAKT